MFAANLAFFWYPTNLKPLRLEFVPLSAANSFWMHTHHNPKDLKTKECPSPEPNGVCFQAPRASYGPRVYTDTFNVPPIQDMPHRFWIFNTGHFLIRNHGDVWNPKIFSMMLEVIQRNSQFQAGSGHNETQRRMLLER
jgi:hypothetical protein